VAAWSHQYQLTNHRPHVFREGNFTDRQFPKGTQQPFWDSRFWARCLLWWAGIVNICKHCTNWCSGWFSHCCGRCGRFFLGAGVANRVRIISLIFSALQRGQRGAGWGGLGGGHLDNVIIKAHVLKIDWRCQIWQVLSINYWFRLWKRAQRLLGRFRAPRRCSSFRFPLLLLLSPFPLLMVP